MKNRRTMVLCVAIGLAWNIAGANDAAPGPNPYATIAARNIFGLQSAAPAPPVPVVDAPPPKILATGTMSIFGREQVLFKVLNREDSPGARTIETFFVLAEGEHEAGVEVVKIDQRAGTVTFGNHGVAQQISLIDRIRVTNPG
jgi:hypothetical protein